MNNRDIRYHSDALIIEAFLADDRFVKNAEGVLSDLSEKVKEYVGSKIKPGHEVESVLSMLAPGAIFLFLRGSNPILAFALSTLAGTFQINVEEIIESIFNAVKGDVAAGKKVSPEKIDAAVESAGSEQPVPEEKKEEEDDGMDIKSSLKFVRKLKLAMIAYHNDTSEFQFSKYAAPSGVTKMATKSFLSRIIGWVFKAILLSAGFLLIGDLINDKVLDRPNSLSGGVQKGRVAPSASPSTQPIVVPTQTKFKPNPSYQNEIHNVTEPWAVSIPATASAIEQMLVDFAKEVYQGLDGKEGDIRSAPAFQIVKNRIVNNNKSNEGYNVTSIPKYFTSKKQIVDTFIDGVAKMTA